MNSNKKTESIKDSKTSEKFVDFRKIAEDKIKEQNEVEEIDVVENTTEDVLVSQSLKERYAVVNCELLNVRMSPSLKSDVLCVVKSGTEMKVDVENSTDTWIKVLEPNGVGSSGYCMREWLLLLEK